MRPSNIALLVGAIILLLFGTGSSEPTNYGQATTGKLLASTDAQTSGVRGSTFLRTLQGINEELGGEGGEGEERGVNFSWLTKWVPGTPANRAAKVAKTAKAAAKEAALKTQLATGLDDLINDGNKMIARFKSWKRENVDPKDVFHTLQVPERTSSKDLSIYNGYVSYLNDLKR